MQCPFCGEDSKVLDSRPTNESIRRRRRCNSCKRRFTTYERLGPSDLRVTKRDERVEPFDHEKLVRAMARVCAGRPVSHETLVRQARTIEAQLMDSARQSIPSWELADQVLDRLRELDPVASRRFAADYFDEAGQLRTAPRTGDDAEDLPQLGLFGDDPDG